MCIRDRTQGLHLPAKFHLNVFIVSASGGQKPQFWADFDFWGLLYRPPFTDEGHIWCAIADHGIRLCAKFCLDRFILSNCVGEKPHFLQICWTLAFSGVAYWQQSEKVNTGAQPQGFPYPSRSCLCSNAFMAKSGAQSLKSVMNKQTKNSTFLATPAAGKMMTKIPAHQTWNGDRGP